MPAYPFINFQAGLRKPALIPYHYFSPGDNISWIQSIPTGISYAQSAVTGTINGVNRMFTIPGIFGGVIAVVRNGITLDPAVAYTLAGSTITFTNSPAYIPQTGDDLMVILG